MDSPELIPATEREIGRKPRNGLALFWLIGISGIVLDQLVKDWARDTLRIGQSLPGGKPWPGVFEIQLAYNEGVAFGMLQGKGVLMTPVALAMAGMALWYVYKHRYDPTWSVVAMASLFAGAIGNMIDRVWLGKVTDMFYIRAINFPIFNIADTFITLCAVLLMIGWTVAGVKEGKKP